MHDIPQGTHGTRYNGDLLNRFGVLLERAHKSMAHFMVRDDLALLCA